MRLVARVFVAAAFLLLWSVVPSGSAGSARLWRSAYDGPASHGDRAVGISLSPSGTEVFVTGASDGPKGKPRFATIAYDAATGATTWVTRQRAVGGAFPNDIAVDAHGVFVSGENDRTGAMLTDAYDPSSGAKLWTSTYSHTSFGATAIAVDPPEGRVFVTGGGRGIAILAYDAATGEIKWRTRTGTFGGGTDVAVSPNGLRVFVAGNTSKGARVILSTATSGGEPWATHNIHGFSAGPLALSPNARMVYVGGWTGSLERTFTVRAYRATSGALKWVKHLSIPGGSFVEGIAANSRRVFATGTLGTDPEAGIVTASFRADTGAIAWVHRLHLSDGYPRSLALAPTGRYLVITGRGSGGLEAVSYKAGSGRSRWIRQLSSTSGGADVVVGPDGTSFMTGFRGGGRSSDFLTIAYSR